MNPVTIDRDNPWPGLIAFDEGAEQFFNGRTDETAELRRLVMQAPLTVLFGASGLGKTSLLQAGLFPLLRRSHFLPIYIRLNLEQTGRPLIDQARLALRSEMVAQKVDAPPMGESESLWEYLHRSDLELWSEQNHLLTPLFVFDQFEEVFTLGSSNPDWISQLRVHLADLIENRLPSDLDVGKHSSLALDRQGYKILLSFREDFLPGVEGWKREIPSMMRNRLRLLPMSGERAYQAIHDTAPHLVSEPVAWRIVAFVAGAKDSPPQIASQLSVDPALLSLVCRGLNEQRKADRKDTLDEGLLIGSGQAIVSTFYEESLKDIPQAAATFIEDRLLTASGFRSTAPVEDLLKNGLTKSDVAKLVDRRLLRVEPRLGVDHLELTHDVLTTVVRGSRDARAETERREKDEASWKEREEKIQRELRQATRTRWGAMVLAAVVVLLVLVGAYLVYTREESRTQLESNSKELKSAQGELANKAAALENLHKRILRQYGWPDSRLAVESVDGQTFDEIFLANEQLQILAPPQTRVQIRYFRKDSDSKAMDRLVADWRSDGYNVDDPKSPNNDVPSNAILFSDDTPVIDLKRIALGLIRAGVRLRGIDRLRKGGNKTVQIVYDPKFYRHVQWSVQEMLARRDFVSPRVDRGQARMWYVLVMEPADPDKVKSFLDGKHIDSDITAVRDVATSPTTKEKAEDTKRLLEEEGYTAETRQP